jgi:hypothetical protein
LLGNAPFIDRSILLRHIRDIEGAYGLSIIGVLPLEVLSSAGQDDGIAFLAEKTADISLMDLVNAESDLGDRLGRPTRIVLKSGLRGQEAEDLPRHAQPL